MCISPMLHRASRAGNSYSNAPGGTAGGAFPIFLPPLSIPPLSLAQWEPMVSSPIGLSLLVLLVSCLGSSSSTQWLRPSLVSSETPLPARSFPDFFSPYVAPFTLKKKVYLSKLWLIQVLWDPFVGWCLCPAGFGVSFVSPSSVTQRPRVQCRQGSKGLSGHQHSSRSNLIF